MSLDVSEVEKIETDLIQMSRKLRKMGYVYVDEKDEPIYSGLYYLEAELLKASEKVADFLTTLKERELP